MKNNIKELRTKYKLSQEALAKEVGVTRQTINSIEKGKYVASLPLAFRIASYFNLKIEDVFELDDDVEQLYERLQGKNLKNVRSESYYNRY